MDQRDNLKRFMMHRKLTASGADLAAKKAARNRGRGKGIGPSNLPKKVGFVSDRPLPIRPYTGEKFLLDCVKITPNSIG